jgi:diguanylate cyclase (GGDEF)-like protein/PAS domain S-box-containing protein
MLWAVINEPEFKSKRRPPGELVRILLVEDDPDFAELVQTQLRRMRWVEARLESAGTLAEALARLNVESFGLVITDLNLPDSSGLATVSALTRAGDQPVIVLTGDATHQVRAAAIEAGAYDFLHKDQLSAAALERLVRLGALQASAFRALRDSEARFRSLLDLSSDFYWESDAEHRVVRIEHGLRPHPAVNPAQLGKARWEMPSTYPDAEGWAAHRAAMEAHRPFRDFPIARRDDDGVERWRSLSGEPAFDERGAFIGYRGTGKDISAQKRAEEDLSRFRLALDTSPDMILLIDRASMRNVDVNTTACRLLGYSREELLARGPQDMLPLTRAELEALYDRMIADPTAVTGMRSYYRCKDGSQLPFESTRRVLSSGGRWIIAIIARDIREHIAAETALRESEALLRQTFDLAASGIAHVSLDGRFLRVNPRLRQILGYAEQELIGRSVKDISYSADRDLTDAQRARVRSGETTSASFEKRYLRKDGSVVWVSLTVALARDELGVPQYEISVIEDINARKQSEAEVARLSRMYRALGAANEAILRAKSQQEVFERVCEIAVAAGGFLLGTVFLLDARSKTLSRAAASGTAAALVEEVAPSIDESQPGGKGLIGHACRTGRPAISNDYAADPRTQGRARLGRPYELGSVAVFPLRAEGELAGVFGLQHAQPHAFTDELIALLQRLADSISFALENFHREKHRRRAKRQLGESEQRFRSLTGLSSDIYWEQDAEYRFTTFSRTASDKMRPGDRMIGKHRWDQHYFNMSEADWAAHRALLDARQPFRDLELGRIDDAGEKVWVSVSGEPVFDAAGAFTGYRGVGKDISERKAAEEALRESEARFRSLTELSADFYWETDAQHLVVKTTHDAKHPAINAQGGQIGKARWDLPSTRPDAAGWAAHRATLEAHLPFREFELARLDRHGIERHLSLSGEPMFDAKGAFCGYRGVGKEITARKREEQLLGLEHRAARCLSEADSASAALRALIRAICETQSWECGRYFGWDEGAAALSFQESWHVPSAALEVLIEKSRALTYQPGAGLIGQAYGSVDPLWVTDLASDPRVKSGLARDAGMRGAFLFPALADGKPIGVFVFHSRQVREPHDRLLDAVRMIGSQVGQFVKRRHAELARREMELQYRRTFELAGTGLAHIGLDRRFIRVNPRMCELFGYSEAEMLGRPAKQFSHPDDLDVINEQRPRLYAGEIDAVRGEKRYLRKDGSVIWLAFTLAVERDAQGKALYEITAYDDVTHRKRAEERQAAHLRYQERIARFGRAALVERAPADLVDKAVQAVLEALAADAVAYFEAEPANAGLVLRALVGVADAGAPAGAIACEQGSALQQAMQSGMRLMTRGDALPAAWAHGLGSVALVPVRGDNKVRGLLCVGCRQSEAFGAEQLNFVDAAASVLSSALQRIDSEARLAYLAQFDPLTGLPNRALLADRFSQMIVQAKRRDALLAVLFIDLDGFKSVNDTLGHAGGDALLKEVAVRLQSTVRGGDTVARISGDEFAVVLGDLARTEDAALVAQKVINRLAASVDIGGKEVFVTASVGIAAFPGDGADADTLIVAADAAMYRAKQSGRNAFQFFTAEINQRTRARAQMGADLRRALERGEFALVYQPKVELADRRVVGAEALLRWKHPERGMVSPAEFVPVLEETGLIVPVGDWVLQRACEDLKAWQAAGLAVVPVAVNLSARQFRRQDLDAHIKSLVAAAGIDARLIELEITESQLMQDPDQAIRVMRALRDAGIRIAIDDFGTGYSSLSTLRRFPVAALKIDRSFVKDMSSEGGDASIVRTVIEMAYALGFTVVAEGVETEEQAKALYLLRCQQAQGYLFARPMPAQEFLQRLERRAE